MLEKVIGGPYDGIALDHNDIKLYCSLLPIGRRSFIVMPPFEKWDAVRRGDLDKNGPFSESSLLYELVRTQTGAEAHFDGTGELLAAAEKEEREEQVGRHVGPPTVQCSGTYYRCLRGDVDNLALAAQGSFGVRDAKGRDWICHPVAKEVVENPNPFVGLADVLQAQGKSHSLGLASQGTKVVMLLCDNRDELPAKLAENLD